MREAQRWFRAQAMELNGLGACLQTLCGLRIVLLCHRGRTTLFAKNLHDHRARHSGLHQGDQVANPDFLGRFDVVPVQLHAATVDFIGCQ